MAGIQQNLSLRERNKTRVREQIVAAAQDLLLERGGVNFTVDELAESAGISRRTVFNYFDSLDAILVTVCVSRVDRVLQQISAKVVRGKRTRDFAELIIATRSVLGTQEFLSEIEFFCKTLGADPATGSKHDPVFDATVLSLSGGLVRELMNPTSKNNEFDLHLFTSMLFAAVRCSTFEWYTVQQMRPASATLTSWQMILERACDRLALGFSR